MSRKPDASTGEPPDGNGTEFSGKLTSKKVVLEVPKKWIIRIGVAVYLAWTTGAPLVNKYTPQPTDPATTTFHQGISHRLDEIKDRLEKLELAQTHLTERIDRLVDARHVSLDPTNGPNLYASPDAQ